MGKMKMNSKGFSNDPNATPITPEVILPTDVIPKRPPAPQMPQADHDIKIKWDMVSNIVSDACGVVKEIIKAVSAVAVEREKTRQVEINAGAQIRAAEENTEQVRIQETEETTRIRMQYLAQIKQAELELQKKQAEIEKEKEQISSDERMFNSALHAITEIVQSIIRQNDEYQKACKEAQYSDRIHENNKLLVDIIDKVVRLYTDA